MNLKKLSFFLAFIGAVGLYAQPCTGTTDEMDDLFLIKNSGENARLFQEAAGSFVSAGATFSELFAEGYDHIIPGDWNTDGTCDLFLIKSTGENARLFQDVDGGFASSGATFSELFDDGYDHIIPGDWNGDGRDDLFLIKNTGENARLMQQPSGEFMSSGVTFSELFDDGFDHIIPGDWNGDGRDDLFLIKNTGENARLFQGATGVFTSSGATFSELFDDAFDHLIPGDWNADGREDLYLIKNSGENARLLQGEDGNFAATALTFSELFDDAFDHLIPGDWNSDGRDDLYLIKNSGENARLLQSADGMFTPTAITFSELFDDGYDFILPCRWNGCMTVSTEDIFESLGVNLNKVFPNPVRDLLTLEVTSERNASLALTLVDVNGRLVRTFPAVRLAPQTQSINLPLTDVAVGIYFLRMQLGRGVGVRRVVVGE